MLGRSKLETNDARLVERQPLDDLGARLRIGGGGERNARHLRETLVQHRQLQIFRAEIVAPLRHAMGLVDGEQRDSARFEQAASMRGIISRSGAI